MDCRAALVQWQDRHARDVLRWRDATCLGACRFTLFENGDSRRRSLQHGICEYATRWCIRDAILELDLFECCTRQSRRLGSCDQRSTEGTLGESSDVLGIAAVAAWDDSAETGPGI